MRLYYTVIWPNVLAQLEKDTGRIAAAINRSLTGR